MIPEPLSYMDQAVLARFTRQELRTAWHCRLLALVCPWRDTQGEGLDPVPHPHWAICQLVHLHGQCEILMASTRTKGH